MSLSLNARELQLLRSSLAVVSSPLEFDELDEWRSAVNEAVRELLDGDQALFALHGCGAPLFQSNEYDDATIGPYVDYFRHVDEGLRRVRERGLTVFCRRQLFDGDLPELWTSECYNDFLSPNEMEDSIGMMVGPPADAAAESPRTGLWIHHRTFGRPNAGERGVELLRLLHPAFVAATATARRFHGVHGQLATLLDTVDDAAGIVDADGTALHLNEGLRDLLADPARRELRIRIEASARAVLKLDRCGEEPDPALLHQHFVAAGRRYAIQAVRLERPLHLPAPAAMIVVRRSVVPPRPEQLRARFGLTARQAEAAILIWEEKTNREIAAELSISPHTARHHTESVLRKLGIHSRKDVRRVVEEDRQGAR